MPRTIPGPYDPREMARFLDTFLYEEEAFLIDEVLRLDAHRREIAARVDTTRRLPFARHQRVGPHHPGHVSGPELVMLTGNLGCLHAWFFHGCRWDEGWVGYGNRIHRADFSSLALIGPSLELESRETRARAGSDRTVIRYAFEFRQEGRLVYYGDQTAQFFREGPATSVRSPDAESGGGCGSPGSTR